MILFNDKELADIYETIKESEVWRMSPSIAHIMRRIEQHFGWDWNG